MIRRSVFAVFATALCSLFGVRRTNASDKHKPFCATFFWDNNTWTQIEFEDIKNGMTVLNIGHDVTVNLACSDARNETEDPSTVNFVIDKSQRTSKLFVGPKLQPSEDWFNANRERYEDVA